MKTKKRLLPAVVLSLFLAAGPAEAQGAQFSNVYVFGDSLSDAGYYRPFLASLGLPSSLVATMGRFSTNPGPVWSELIAQFYGVTPAPSNAGGTIFAQGGARVSLTPGVSTPPGQPERPISTQIGEFLAQNNNVADPDALYAIWAGANDVFANLGAFSAGAISAAQLQTNVLGAATTEIAQIQRLMQAGARFIMVFGLPDIGRTPAFAGSSTAGSVSALSAGYNTTLFVGLAAAGIRVIPVDTAALLAEILANPTAFGFTNVTGVACGPFPPFTTGSSSLFCHPGNLVAGGADQTFLFADAVHPTSATHRIVAQFAQSLIEGPFNYSIMAEAPLRMRAMHVMGVNDGLMTGHYAEVGKLTAFASGGPGGFDVDRGPGVAGFEGNNRHITVGVTMRASESVTLGLAFGKTRSSGSFGDGLGGFRVDELAWSVFATAKWRGFYASGVASISDLEFNDVRRNIVLGNLTRTATASPDGSNASASIVAGYDFPLGRFTVGPTVGITWQNVEVNEFEESDAGAANLRILAQKRRSEVWSAGLRASFEIAGWTPWLRVTADKERKDGERLVSASPLSLASRNEYDIPAYRSDSSFTTAALGVRGWLTDRVGLAVSVYRVTGRSGTDEEGASAMLSYKF